MTLGRGRDSPASAFLPVGAVPHRDLHVHYVTKQRCPRPGAAAACEFLDIVELLLQSGADPTLRDQDGCLPEEVTGCKAVSLMLQRHRASKA
ncbi:Acyl-CoA-binding domain-containing protein 6 [Microtus ochrogaster]|uniref:Acyl-CoA-binding domain-containing protein 6 n=1 Tax=Microtus ochrogaster TaxID=79684 RepID=A0A8J6KNV6_MICOH|nr:Acyl-CoA-binding domain-containing protein 6 [Microtus ochrogaster]